MQEPLRIAFALAVLGVLLGVCALLSRTAGRFGLPLALAFLAIGTWPAPRGWAASPSRTTASPTGWGRRPCAVILFDGGLNSSWSAMRRVLAPASVLATVGVALTAGILALGARFLGWGWGEALLLGAVVSSTDAAAVFSLLRRAGIRLQRRVSAVEVESGLNDPMAVILTSAVTAWLAGPRMGPAGIARGP